MEHKVLEPIELTDAELDIVSGGSFVGIQQSNRGGNVITKSDGSGAATAYNFNNTNTQTNTNSGSVTNFGAVSG
jgi:hypothetical protein